MFDTADPTDDIPRCTVCPRELHGPDYGRLACLRCEDRMYGQLNTVASLWSQLPDATYRPVVEREPGRSMSIYPGMPGNATIINLTAGGDDTPLGRLRAVEDDWRRARGFTVQTWRPAPDVMESVLRFLRVQLPWACAQHKNPRSVDGEPLLPDVLLLSEALHRTVSDLQAAVTGEPRARTIPVRCLAEWDDGVQCGAEMRVGANTLRMICPGCSAVWTRDAFIRLAESANQFGAAA